MTDRRAFLRRGSLGAAAAAVVDARALFAADAAGVARRGLPRAATAPHLSQPAVSKAVRGLERQVGAFQPLRFG